MDWDAKTPSLWDWENLAAYNGKTSAIHHRPLVQPTDWGTEVDGGIDNGSSVYSSGGGGGSVSDLVNGSTSGASADSSAKAGTKVSEINFETINCFPKNLSKKKELASVEGTETSGALVGSVGSGEPLIGLKLGKRTYFEDVATGNPVKTSSFSPAPATSSILVKKSRASNQNVQTPLCQVEGCDVDLTAAKDYHRRHRVCESHSKCPRVIVDGQERRFCQQCSRFHGLPEFDEKKRSCRRRLSDHNARRRKPQPDAILFNSGRLSSSFYATVSNSGILNSRQQMNLALNRVPLVQTRPTSNHTWEGTCNFKLSQSNGSCIRTSKMGSINGQLHFPSIELPNNVSSLRCDLDGLLPFKGTTAEVLSQGQEGSMTPSTLDATSDLRRALSLLSTNSWGSTNPGSTSLDQLVHANHTSVASPTMQAVVHQGLHLANSEYWQAEHPPAETRVPPLSSNSNSSQFQEFQLFKAPHEPSFFYSNQMQ